MPDLKTTDYDRYLISLFAPEPKKQDLQNLYHFNNELANIRDNTTESMTGFIKLAWWQEAIEDLYNGKLRKHEIIKPLAQTIEKHNLEKEEFLNLIKAREKEIDNFEFDTLEEFEEHAKNLSLPIIKLSQEILGNSKNQNNLATTYTMAGIIASSYFHFAKGNIILPKDILKQHNITKTDIIDRHLFDKAKPAIKQLCQQIEQLIPKKYDKNDQFIKLHIILAKLYLNEIKKKDYNLFTRNLAPSTLKKQITFLLKTFF